VIATPDALDAADKVPQVVPLQPAPDNVQLTPLFCESFVTVAVKFCVSPVCTFALVGATLTAITGAAVTVIVAVPFFVPSVTEVAVSVTLAGTGTLLGAVYVIAAPEALEGADKVPHVAPLQPVPESAQVTPLFCESFVTVAVKFCVSPVCTLALVGATLTEITGAAVTVIVAVLCFVPSATEVAVNVTVAGLGTLAGAVYVIAAPDALDVADKVPHVVPLQPAPARVQVTPLFCESFVTVAVKFCVSPICTLALVGVTLTAIAGGAVTVIVAVPCLVPSATEVAVNVTVAGLGTLAGALYVITTPEALDAAESVPQVAPLQPVPESAQVTPLFCESFVTVAVKACVPLPA
jgi:hypothetical protein